MPRADSATDLPVGPLASLPTVLKQDAPRPKRKPKANQPLPDDGHTYVWELAEPNAIPLEARAAHGQPPRHEPQPAPEARLSHPTPWSRMWRTFLAGAIMGAATVKAADLLLHRKSPRD